MKCPECGNDLSVGYSQGDICLECHDIGEAADEIIRQLRKCCPALAVVHTTVEGGMKDIIKSVVREKFF